uniref:Uncharacterized protein n=1 Tax=Anguilla anguilla TaxID=7936 RepID=A0A0E9SFT2_ANGAN
MFSYFSVFYSFPEL